MVRADWVPGPQQGSWTYRDYATIPDDGRRYEVVRGVLYMPPSPDVEHQRTAGEIFALIRDFVRPMQMGEVFVAPLDVELEQDTVVQPDVFVILKEHADRVGRKRIIGAPDLAVE
ncbi:MAG: Uma2 family endonuclease, partial [Ktedonobacteraceae bacterium]|nr:Uma2 family endonuclease [Ktedonobacteraceae bacterium]